MKLRIQIVAAVMTALVLPSPAPPLAAQTPPLQLTLADAIARGMDASHRLAELAARETAAGASAAGRQAADRPQVSVQSGYMRTNHVEPFGILTPGGIFRVIYPDIPDNYRTRLDLQWPIYAGGRPDALARAATAESVAATRDREAARGEVRLEITRAYWAVVTARESVRVVDGALARVNAQRNDVRNRLQVGLVPPSDLLAVEAQASRQRMLLVQAENARGVALADLRRQIGGLHVFLRLPTGTQAGAEQ